MKYILSIDQGTSSTRSIIFDENANIVSSAQKEHRQIFPHKAWVEHNPIEIKNSVFSTMKEAINGSNLDWTDINSIGVTNQRETIVAWNRKTGLPLHNAIVWQCRRTSGYVDELKSDNYEPLFQKKTGLVLDAYFSATKMKWLLDNSEKVKQEAKLGNLAFGTIDSWIIYLLSGEHKTDDSNASRTLIYNINNLSWDPELLEIFNISEEFLPQIQENAGDEPFGYYKKSSSEIAIRGVLGDQQAALFGQGAYNPGEIKSTYGTGNFILLNTGSEIIRSKSGLLSTIAWRIDKAVTYALEGSVFVTGSAFQWLRDNLNLISSYNEIDAIARKENHNGGVVFVPALVGLGAPHWDSYARGLIIGITQSTSKSNLVNATIDSIALQTEEIINLMRSESELDISELSVDGGIANSHVLLQRQANFSQMIVNRPRNIETTALGAALMAGLNDVWENLIDLKSLNLTAHSYNPQINIEEAMRAINQWKRAVSRAKGWIQP